MIETLLEMCCSPNCAFYPLIREATGLPGQVGLKAVRFVEAHVWNLLLQSQQMLPYLPEVHQHTSVSLTDS